jgi:hypothetical protein
VVLLLVAVIVIVVACAARASHADGPCSIDKGAGLVDGAGAIGLGNCAAEEGGGGGVVVTNGEVEG